MKNFFWSKMFGFAVLTIVTFALAGAADAQMMRNQGKTNGRERHSKITQAIRALENAKNDLQKADHDFCGHREEALEATNNAISQLRMALESDRTELIMPVNSNVSFINAAYSQNRNERHPEIRRAINTLNRAKDDLQDAAHDFHGHREAALDATNNALRQLQVALSCDRR